ncbi:MAG: formylglycine-generating enzyme family protein [Planctomycetes bacterium]|nr:formylglycine-generating enzyme family protein [Planctomycetota bacterium]
MSTLPEPTADNPANPAGQPAAIVAPFEDAPAPANTLVADHLAPYPGLRPFEENDAPRFFGRGVQKRQMLKRLEQVHFLAVIGTSGCGKSSLVHAGLLPALRQGWLLGTGTEWKMAKLRPGDSPLRNLAAALHRALTQPEVPTAGAGVLAAAVQPTPAAQGPAKSDESEDRELGVELTLNTLNRGRYGILDLVAESELESGANVLVLVDQFEELFRYREKIEIARPPESSPEVKESARPSADRDVRQPSEDRDAAVLAERNRARYARHNEAIAFVDLLLAVAGQTQAPVYVVITMRSDFLGQCDLFQGLPEAINQSQFLTPRMTSDQLRDAIVGPLDQFAASATPALVGRILDEIGAEPDQLPLMQHALMRTWNVACNAPDASVPTIAEGRHDRQNLGDAGNTPGLANVATPRQQSIVLTEAHYLHAHVGGVKNALDTHAEEIYRSLAGTVDLPDNHSGDSPGTAPEKKLVPTFCDIYVWAINRYPGLLVKQTKLQTELEQLLREKTTARGSESAAAPGAQTVARDPTGAPWGILGAMISARELRLGLKGLERLREAAAPPQSRRQRICERMFRSLCYWSSSGQVVRRLATVAEIAAVADVRPEEVISVAEAFLAPDCALLTAPQPLDAKTTLDISHEALFRQWKRCRTWIETERESARIWKRVVEQVALARIDKAGRFSHADLLPIEEWQAKQKPTAAWVERYAPAEGLRVSFDEACAFLRMSRRWANAVALMPLAVFFVIIGLLTWFASYREQTKREQLVEQQITHLLETTDAGQIGPLLGELKSAQPAWRDRLLKEFDNARDPSIARRNAALALLTEPPGATDLDAPRDYVVGEILRSPPDRLPELRKALKSRADDVTAEFWKQLKQTQDRPPRLRAAAALAELGERDRIQWNRRAIDVVRELAAVPAFEVKDWTEALRGARQYLTPELARLFADRAPERRAPREVAAQVLAGFWSDSPEKLVDWLATADSAQEFQPFARQLQGKATDETIQHLSRIADGPHFADDSPQTQEKASWNDEWKSSLNATVCLVQIGQFPLIRTLLLPASESGSGSDPTFSTYLIDRFQELGAIDNVDFFDLVDRETEPAIQQTLLLALGDYDSLRLPTEEHSRRLATLETIYRTHADAGVHSAAGWACQRWREAAGEATDLTGLNQSISQEPLAQQIQRHRWFINLQGQTFVVIPSPGKFELGDRGQRRDSEISYRFAIATHEVTFGQFEKFVKKRDPQKFPVNTHLFELALKLKNGKQDDQRPASRVSWFAAAAYCNWLSQQEGLDEQEWCYLPNEKGEYGEGMKIAANARHRTGYRLPTEDEWEYVCRNGASTEYSFGEGRDVLGQYAWFYKNSSEPAAVGRLRPNGSGLFDIHGNLWEWCQDRADKRSVNGADEQPVASSEHCIVRGGSYLERATEVGASARKDFAASAHEESVGFRPARSFR